MANSVVKVTDSMLNDNLLLLVGEDGTVSPDKQTVESFLSTKTDATNIQVMHINKSDSESIDVSIEDVTYLPDADGDCVVEDSVDLDLVAKNLHNVKLDHDYFSRNAPLEEVDELAKTLGILQGDPPIEAKPAKTVKIAAPKPVEVSKVKAKIAESPKPRKSPKPKSKDEEEVEDEESDDDYDDEMEEEDDSDFELEETKPRSLRKPPKPKVRVRMPKRKFPLKVMKPKEPEPQKIEKPLEPPSPVPEKKTPKKEKKPPKPIPDDFALFSTPDIIRRVGGREPTTPTDAEKPAKIEIRSKSVTESPQSPVKSNRLSLDGKAEKSPPKPEKSKVRKLSIDSPKKKTETSPTKFDNSDNLEEVPSADEIRAIMDENKQFNLETADLGPPDQTHMTLDSSGLDLDPSLLENINNDMISEDILYQVAQSLVSNTELQNAIDKSLNEGMLDPTIMDQESMLPIETASVQETSGVAQKGTQIVRPDGRIVVIPPIERPTTRSRNKRDINRPTAKFTHKPLDEEHVSGNELDSSGEEEEESEDDPNKLWCICNQPHNNRFMICCDTCEEWYHGKCVNITKAMGQQMESEGKEWICLFCKDPQLKRPQAAARRIRKASRNSRQSSDSAGSSQILEGGPGSVPCIVCQKSSRTSSIYCSEGCILAHAQGVEKVVVFDRATGTMLSGNKAPSASNLEQWLKEHPGYEVVRSAGKVVTAKHSSQTMAQSKLKLVKNPDNNGVSLAVHKKGVNVGVLKHLPKHPQTPNKLVKGALPGFKIISKQVSTNPHKVKLIQAPVAKSPTTITPSSSKPKPVQLPPKTTTPPISKEKPMPVKTPKARQAEQTPPPKQENIRDNVQKTLFEQLTNRLKLVDDLKLTEDEVKNISSEIESQLYKCFGDTGQKYRNKYRSLMFNIKDIKNQTLWRRICEKSVNPYQLVRLSPDDLASQELALWREREAKHQLDMIKKSELELLNCNRQYVLKTHKGEQVLEDNRPTEHIDNTEVITSLTGSSDKDGKRESSKDRDKKASKHSHKDRERKSSKDTGDSKDHHHRSASKDHDRSRRRSRSRDRKHNDSKRSRSRGRERHKKSSHKSSRHKKDVHRGSSTDKLDKKSKEILEQLVDNKIVPPLEDRLWKHVSQEDLTPAPVAESDSDHEPTSTVTIPTPPRTSDGDDYQSIQSTSDIKEKPEKEKIDLEDSSVSPSPPRSRSAEIWRGIINMIDVAQISITAHEVSGDCNGLGVELPENLDIVGRISPDTVWDYIGKMKCSNSKIISLVRLNAINVEEKMPYLALYSYLSSRNRLGVVKSTNKAVKDFYILPLASQKPIPQALLPISGPGFEEARPALLLGIIVRDKRKRPMLEPVAATLPVKKTKVETAVVAETTPPQRSYTPPPVKDPRMKLPLPPPVGEEDDDEPYSPEDSDPDSAVPTPSEEVTSAALSTTFLDTSVASSFQPFVNKFDNIPGLGNPPELPSSTLEIQRQMEKLNKAIEMQKSEIDSISQNIATASTEIGTSALANIALPSNLQQILDSIKTIGAVSTNETVDVEPAAVSPVKEKSTDLTIPLILPTNFSRPLANVSTDLAANTIPLNLPSKKKSTESEKSSVLSSLSEEDLIRKAAEMLGEGDSARDTTEVKQTVSFSLTKRAKLDLPPAPGLNDDV